MGSPPRPTRGRRATSDVWHTSTHVAYVTPSRLASSPLATPAPRTQMIMTYSNDKIFN